MNGDIINCPRLPAPQLRAHSTENAFSEDYTYTSTPMATGLSRAQGVLAYLTSVLSGFALGR